MRPCSTIEGARRLNRIIVTQVPGVTIHSLVCRNCLLFFDSIRPFRRLLEFFRFFTGKMSHRCALDIVNVDRHLVFRCRFKIVVDDCARRGIFARRSALIDLFRVMQSHGRLRFIQCHVGRRSLGIDLPQGREVIEYPKRASVGRRDQIIVLYDQVVNGRLR